MAKKPITITIDRSALETVMMGQKRLIALIEEGTAKVDGNVDVIEQLAATMVTFTPDFTMIPGTSRPPQADEWTAYEAGVGTIKGE